jgi:hypothetical protein
MKEQPTMKPTTTTYTLTLQEAAVTQLLEARLIEARVVPNADGAGRPTTVYVRSL